MKILWCLPLSLSLSALLLGAPITRIAFGSCARQSMEQPIWAAVRQFEPEVWIWLGDNIYGDSADPDVLARKYALQKAQPGYAELRTICRIIGTWDDHDFGVNNGGKEFEAKIASQKALLDFLDEPGDSPRRRQEGVYASYHYGSGEESVQVILLDGRYFRDRPESDGADILGRTQWAWLSKELESSSAPLRIVCSGIQVLPEEHGHEKWADFPRSRHRLIDLATRVRGRVVFLSGDRHIAEFSKYSQDEIELLEATSSSLTHSWASFPGERNRHRVGEVYSENNFGSIEIDWPARIVHLQIRSRRGEVVRALEFALEK